MENSELSAFPRNEKNSMAIEYQGLTKREYFAAMAMQGILANENTGLSPNEVVAKESVKLADLLLAELDKTTTHAN